MTSTDEPRSEVLRVAMDYGQFHLYAGEPYANDAFDPSEVVDLAVGGEGIAERDGFIVVTSPHQNTFDMRLRVEVWPERRGRPSTLMSGRKRSRHRCWPTRLA